MKSFAARFVLWLLLDFCLAIIPCGLFAALASGVLTDGKNIEYGWLLVCGLLIFIMLARLFRTVKSSLKNKDVAVGWQILAFLFHFGVLAFGLYVVAFVAMLLLGAGAVGSVGEALR